MANGLPENFDFRGVKAFRGVKFQNFYKSLIFDLYLRIFFTSEGGPPNPP